MGDLSGSKGISPADIRSALDEILQSETFARSERSRELLKYIVERDLEGQSDRLKGFAIALDVFDREDSFDPSTDAVVRVQAGRLRDLLDTYYTNEGATAALRITIPRGTYVPVYDLMLHVPPLAGEIGDPTPVRQTVARDAAPEDTGDAPMAAAVPIHQKAGAINPRLFWAATLTVILLLATITGLLIDNFAAERARIASATPDPAPAATERLSASAALPSISIMPDTDPDLRRALEDAIPRFGSVVYRNDVSVMVNRPLADFYIQAVRAGEHSHSVQFYHRETGIQIGSDQIPGNVQADEERDNIARMLSRFLPVGGALYAFLESDGRLNPLTRCLVLGAAYFTDQNAERHRAAYECHEQLLEDGVSSPLTYAELSSLTIETITDRYDFPPGATLDDALVLARRGVELAPLSANTHRSLSRALLMSGERMAALHEIRTAHALNAYDLGIAASYGDTLVADGNFAGAVSVLERATKAAPVHPTWWDYALFVAAFQTNRTDLVLQSSRNLVGHNRSHYCAARLIAAHLEGNDELKHKMLGELSQRDNNFIRDPLEFYKRGMPREAAEKLADTLYEAGLMSRIADDG